MTEQEHLDFWTEALNLPDFRVVHQRRDSPNDPVCFTVVPAEEVARCPGCGHACATVHRRHDSKPMTSFRQLRLGFRRNSFGDGPGIVPEPLSWCHATTISPLNTRCSAL